MMDKVDYVEELLNEALPLGGQSYPIDSSGIRNAMGSVRTVLSRRVSNR